MNLNVPAHPTLDQAISLQHDLMYHDQDHRYFTAQKVHHDPTDTDLVIHWFESGAFARTNNLFALPNES